MKQRMRWRGKQRGLSVVAGGSPSKEAGAAEAAEARGAAATRARLSRFFWRCGGRRTWAQRRKPPVSPHWKLERYWLCPVSGRALPIAPHRLTSITGKE